MKRSPMKPGTKGLARGKPMARATKPMRSRSKTNAKRDSGGEDKLCRGQPCYLAIPGVCLGGTETTVPAHSNQSRDGKSMGRKADDRFTVPACHACHHKIDQDKQFSKAEKFALWDAAYSRWSVDREQLTNKKESA